MQFNGTTSAMPQPNSHWHTIGKKGTKIRVVVLHMEGTLVLFRNMAGKHFTLSLDEFVTEYSRGH